VRAGHQLLLRDIGNTLPSPPPGRAYIIRHPASDTLRHLNRLRHSLFLYIQHLRLARPVNLNGTGLAKDICVALKW
jgi:hypothetical protein